MNTSKMSSLHNNFPHRYNKNNTEQIKFNSSISNYGFAPKTNNTLLKALLTLFTAISTGNAQGGLTGDYSNDQDICKHLENIHAYTNDKTTRITYIKDLGNGLVKISEFLESIRINNIIQDQEVSHQFNEIIKDISTLPGIKDNINNLTIAAKLNSLNKNVKYSFTDTNMLNIKRAAQSLNKDLILQFKNEELHIKNNDNLVICKFDADKNDLLRKIVGKDLLISPQKALANIEQILQKELNINKDQCNKLIEDLKDWWQQSNKRINPLTQDMIVAMGMATMLMFVLFAQAKVITLPQTMLMVITFVISGITLPDSDTVALTMLLMALFQVYNQIYTNAMQDNFN